MSIYHTLHLNAYVVARLNYLSAVAFETSHTSENLKGFIVAMGQTKEAKQTCDLTSGTWI